MIILFWFLNKAIKLKDIHIIRTTNNIVAYGNFVFWYLYFFCVCCWGFPKNNAAIIRTLLPDFERLFPIKPPNPRSKQCYYSGMILIPTFRKYYL
jgi:hypothetical protein